jgi:nucleotide-binding universal stress UspA family protein
MLEHILIGLDGSDYSQTALQHGLHLAKHVQATLHGIHVVDIVQVESPLFHDLSGAIGAAPQLNLTDQMRQNLEFRGEQLLEQFRQTCEAAQVRCMTYLVTGVVPTEIVRLAPTVDLILLGRGGLHTNLSKTLVGSTVETVVRRSNTPTMVTPQSYQQVRTPLVAIDGSPASQAALQTAVRFVKTLALPLRVVHCAADAETGQQCLDAARAFLNAEDVAGEVDLCRGNPHEDLVQYMREHNHDLLFMGAFGHRRLVEWVLGSTTQYLLRTCPGSLMLCHAAGSAAPTKH